MIQILKFVNKTTFIIALVTISLLGNIVLIKFSIQQTKKADRMQENFDASISTITKKISKIDSSMIVTAKTISLTAGEAKKIGWIEEVVKDIGIKMRNAEQVQKIQSELIQNFKPYIITTNSTPNTFGPTPTVNNPCEEYKDQWTYYKRCVTNGEPEVLFKTSDDLNIVTHFGKRIKKFVFFRYGPREGLNSVNNKNPNNTITYNQVAKIEKK